MQTLPLLLAAALVAAPAGGAVPARPPAPEPESCEGAAAERLGLRAERVELNRAIGDIALGKSRRKRKVSGGEVAAGAAGTVASVLLPFGVGALLSAGASAAAKSARKKKPAAPGPPPPDVPAMIDRLRAIDSRLAGLEGCGGE